MKTSLLILVFLASGLGGLQAGQAVIGSATSVPGAPIPPATEYRVVGRDANQRVWQREAYELAPDGKMVVRIHSYTELATSLHYKDTSGQWAESQELVEAYPGGAVARQGQYQVIFANNLNTYSAIDMQASDGQRLRSNILGLMYVDTSTGDAVMIAEIQDTTGQLIAANQVLYTNAFQGVDADVRYTYRKSSFEQDVILREQPPTPEAYGMSSDTTVLEVVTEFINPPTASITKSPAGNGQTDDTIRWGATKIGQGKAFDLAGVRNPKSIESVTKNYTTVQGRHFLLERVKLKNIQPELKELPLQSGLNRSLPTFASKQLQFPKTPLARVDAQSMKLAAQSPINKGYVLDYVTINASQTNFTFKGDTTYFVSGEYNLSGTTTIEGGAVIKMNSSGQLDIDQNGTLVCKTGPYRPAIFTSERDNSIGEKVWTSWELPALGDVDTFLRINLTNAVVHDCRFSFSSTAIDHGGGTIPGKLDVWNSQFINVDTAVYGYNLGLRNVLVGRSGGSGAAVIAKGPSLIAEQVTADQGSTFMQADYSGATLALTNCLITRQSLIVPGYTATLLTNSSVWLATVTNPVYQVVGGGSFYLTNGSSYQNAGAANISATLRNQLAEKTTHPPVVFSQTNFLAVTNLTRLAIRDTNSSPDLGYHYDALDYIFGGCGLYTNMTISAGVALGWYNTGSLGGEPYGLVLNDFASLTATGTVTAPCHVVRFNFVQETAGGWTSQDWMGFIVFNGSGSGVDPALYAKFTQWSGPTAAGAFVQDNWARGAGYFEECEFYSAPILSFKPSFGFTNCLFDRILISQTDQPGNQIFKNCTFYNGYLGMTRTSWSTVSWLIKDTAFDGTAFVWSDGLSGSTNYTFFDYNAYNTNNTSWQSYASASNTLEQVGPHDLKVANYNWQSSWLGDFYLPTNSALINAGSTTADNLWLYHFTTQTNQLKETNSTVDIGYHYVAMDANGNPIDPYYSSLAYHLSTNAVGHTNGFYNIYDATVELSGWNYASYTGTNLAFLTNSVWSTNFWLKGVQGLSATCIGFSNGLGGQGLATMVSPRHYLFATHMHPEGYLTAFLDTNNVIYWRTTLQRVDVGNDTSVGILNADLPASVDYLPVLPSIFTNYLPTSTIVQGMGMNQDMRIFGQPMTFGNPFVTWNSGNTASFGLTTGWNVTIRGGDSSDPDMLLVGNQLILVSHNYFVGGGPNYAYQIDAINQQMHYLSTNNAAGTDYQLTQFPLTNWPPIN